jgi:hypothetical protein
MSDPTTKDDEAVLAAKARKIPSARRGKGSRDQKCIMKWLKPRDSAADSVCITRALLETALDRHIAAETGLVVGALRRGRLPRHFQFIEHFLALIPPATARRAARRPPVFADSR